MSEDKLASKPGTDPGRPGAGVPVVDRPAPAAGPSRHGAISRRLFTYSNYKSWAEKMRSSWADEEEAATADVSRIP